jgi:dihydrolipoamide dehydrogenase
MADTNFDVIMIGGGPGGYVGAIRASQLGFRTALVEAKHLGGICLNWGCIPTKAMLRSAEMYRNIKHAEDFGLSVSNIGFDLQKIVVRSRSIANKLSGGVAHLLKKNRVTVFDGYGTLLGESKVNVENNGKEPVVLSGKHIVLATGSRPRSFPGLEPDGNLVWTSREALAPKVMPSSLLVIGSGAIGIEFASFFNAFGSEVTVVEMMDQIMPAEDTEIAAFAQKEMEKQGIRFILGATVLNLQRNEDSVTASIEKKGNVENITVSRAITAVGVVPNSENLGLEAAGVTLDERGFIHADPFGCSIVKGVYAIGDVAGGPCLAHKASHEAIICIEKIAGLKDVHPLDRYLIPNCTYCSPQVASIGLTEAQAKETGYSVNVGRFSARGNGKAIALGEPEGMIKTVFNERTGELLGAHMVGAEVTELIQGFAIAKSLETTETELMNTIFPHPTLSEMMHESVLDAYRRAIHL